MKVKYLPGFFENIAVVVMVFTLITCSLAQGSLRAQETSRQYTLDTLAPVSSRALRANVQHFGEPVRLKTDVTAESRIPPSELRVVCKFLGDERVEYPYTMPFEGALVPGYARKVDVELWHTTPGTGEKRVIWANTFSPEQISPTFDISKVRVQTASAKANAPAGHIGHITFHVQGLRVDFAKPVDARSNAVVTAFVDDLEVQDPVLDTEKTHLQICCSGSGTTGETSVKPSKIVLTGFFDQGAFTFTVRVQDAAKAVPKGSLKGKMLRGSLAVRLSVRLLNRRASRSATAAETILIPVELSL
jgi:hypothetical protein